MAAFCMQAGLVHSALHTAFITPVCIKPYKGYLYRTCHEISFIVDKKPFLISAGFTTDLASIPRIAWPIMTPAHSSLIRAAIVHDWFYRKPVQYTRADADLIFYHMLINDNVSSFRASIMYYAVRMFGKRFYNKGYQ